MKSKIKSNNRTMDKEKIVRAVKMILEAVGEDPQREGLINTPQRIANLYEEILAGHFTDPKKELAVYYENEDHEEIVLLKDIPLYSLCEHHLLPFFGKAHVAYIPKKDRLLGLSKIVRFIDLLSRRLQLQERLTKQIADLIMSAVNPYGVLVVIEAEHFCITMRGIKKPGTKTITSAVRGIFLTDLKTRAEALSLIRN